MFADILKKIFGSKFLLKMAIDELDMLEPFLAAKFEEGRTYLNGVDSQAKAKWAVDKVQEFLRTKLGITE